MWQKIISLKNRKSDMPSSYLKVSLQRERILIPISYWRETLCISCEILQVVISSWISKLAIKDASQIFSGVVSYTFTSLLFFLRHLFCVVVRTPTIECTAGLDCLVSHIFCWNWAGTQEKGSGANRRRQKERTTQGSFQQLGGDNQLDGTNEHF